MSRSFFYISIPVPRVLDPSHGSSSWVCFCHWSHAKQQESELNRKIGGQRKSFSLFSLISHSTWRAPPSPRDRRRRLSILWLIINGQSIASKAERPAHSIETQSRQEFRNQLNNNVREYVGESKLIHFPSSSSSITTSNRMKSAFSPV